MSVYFEATENGRLDSSEVSRFGVRRALKLAKRREAEERNARTPYERTKRSRRDLAGLSKRVGRG
jgi:hypothetical protein